MKNIIAKIWIINALNIGDVKEIKSHNLSISSFLSSKLYQNNAIDINIINQNIALADLSWLASKCETFYIQMATVINDNGSYVELEKIVAALPNIKDFYYDLEDVTSTIITDKTAQELVNIPHFSNLNIFLLSDIPESFNIDDFYDYIKKNKKTSIHLNFSDYQNRYQVIVDEIVETQNHDYLVPYITFPGMNQSSYKKLCKLFYG